MRIFRISQEWYTEEVATNTKDPNILRDILKRGKNDGVSYYAAQNPKCPPEILADVLKRGKDDTVSWIAAEHPKCPPEILAEVLKRGNNDWVSICAARNPNCPPLERVLWMKATGKIKDYDPNNPKHFLEQEEVKEDKDLEELKKLIE